MSKAKLTLFIAIIVCVVLVSATAFAAPAATPETTTALEDPAQNSLVYTVSIVIVGVLGMVLAFALRKKDDSKKKK